MAINVRARTVTGSCSSMFLTDALAPSPIPCCPLGLEQGCRESERERAESAQEYSAARLLTFVGLLRFQ